MRRPAWIRGDGRGFMVGSIAIVLLLVIDAVLIWFAAHAHEVPGEPAAAHGPASTSSTPPPSATPTAASAAEPPGEAQRLLAAVSESIAWRATTGSCEQPGSIEITTDAGQTWQPAGLELRGEVLALGPAAGGETGVVVVTDERCNPVVMRTFTGGTFWEESPDQAVGSYLAPDGEFIADGRPAAAPCEQPTAFVTSGSEVALCGDVAKHRTAGGDWTDVAGGVIAIGPGTAGVAFAQVGAEGCAGTAIGIISDGQAQTQCSDIPATEAVAVSAFDNVVWIWSADDVSTITI